MVNSNDSKSTIHKGWIVLQRMMRIECTTFIAPSIFGTKQEADLYASNFDNVVAIIPIEWEE